VSFPAQLVLERGNIDIQIFLLLTATAACVCMRSRAFWLPSALLTLLAVSFKVYPVIGFVGWLAFGQVAESHGWRVSRAVKAAVLSGCVVGLALSLPWMFASAVTLGQGGMHSLGLKAIGYINVSLIQQIGVGSARWVIRGLIISKLLALVVGAVLAVRLRLHSALQHHFQEIGDGFFDRFSQTFFLITSWTWMGCYILTISYDYKHIYMLPGLFLLLSMVDRCAALNPRQYALAWILIAASMIFILFPHLHYNGLNNYAAISGLCELVIELLVVPFYAGALMMLRTSHRFQRRTIPSLAQN
jgi:hypothetical protein